MTVSEKMSVGAALACYEEKIVAWCFQTEKNNKLCSNSMGTTALNLEKVKISFSTQGSSLQHCQLELELINTTTDTFDLRINADYAH